MFSRPDRTMEPLKSAKTKRLTAWLLTVIIWFGGTGLALHQIQSEGHTRADQVCKIFEDAQHDQVDELQRTYDYLVKLTPAEVHSTLNVAILTHLPQQEADAHIDRAPQFCDDPGLGRPEPDDPIPVRPAKVTQELKAIGLNAPLADGSRSHK